MTVEERYNPIINGFKICKVCKENKEVTSSFSFHKTTGYYLGTCKECANKISRLKRPVSTGRREMSIFIKQKKCLKCLEVKDLACFPKYTRNTSNICSDCATKHSQEKLQKRLNKGYLPDTAVKTCIVCNEEQNISNFSFSKNIGYYSSYCKTCDVKRKQARVQKLSEIEKEELKAYGRNWHYSHKAKSLFNVYNKFDFHKNLENDLTIEYLDEQLKLVCTYCGYTSTGLDRLDNSKGHSQNNCVPCCWECNTAKMDNFTLEEMKIIGLAIKQVKDTRLCQL